jgi:serine/threonine protein phosphatase PrpC
MLAIEVALLTDRGGRNYNEDACGHWHSDRHLCCVLADGAGGHGGGDIASKLIVQELISRFAHEPTCDGPALGSLLRQTNTALIEQRMPGTARADMHSTAVCLVIDFVDHQAHWAHAGDSRLYWLRGGRVHARTRDHSLVQALVDAGVISEAQMQGHAQRSELRSALGVPADQLEVSSAEGFDAVQAGDVFVLCTDGLWEYISDEKLERTLAESATPRAWLDALSAGVVAAAAHKASHDNFTALVVWTRPA